MTQQCLFTTADWDAYARCYDTLTTLRPYQDMLQDVLRTIPWSARSVLDLGCGTGTLLQLLLRERAHITATGVDNSPKMLHRAREKLQDLPATIYQGDLEDDRTVTGVYDCVISTNVLYTMHNPSRFLCRLSYALAPGGTVIIVTPKAGYDNGLILKAHCEDTRPDSFWRDPHASAERERALIREAFGNTSLAADASLVAQYNREIAGTQSFHFLDVEELETLFRSTDLEISSLATTYAQQNWLVVATKR